MYSYTCVTCGEVLRSEDLLVPLAPLVLDGTTDFIKNKNPLYITKKDLDELIANTQAVEGIDDLCNVITMRYLLEVAYRPVNREKLIAPAKNAEEAYAAYLKSYQQIKDMLAGITVEEDKEEEEASSSGFSFFAYEDADEEEESVWSEIFIPGFNSEQAIQLCENFQDGQCNCHIQAKKGYGYSFRVLRDGATNGVTQSFYCPNCKREIVDCAFEKRQIVIGFAGNQRIGRTCLIFSMCNYLMSEGGVLKIPNEDIYTEFTWQYSMYRNGYCLPKTGHAVLNPSVLFNDVIWTFIDIPGELMDDGSGNLDVDRMIRYVIYIPILCCDAYLFCTEKRELSDPLYRGSIADNFFKFMQFAHEYRTDNIASDRNTHCHRFPVLLTMTQIDKDFPKQSLQRGTKVPYCQEEYHYQDEYNALVLEGLEPLIERVGKIAYTTPLSTSAYGFPPTDPNWFEYGEPYRTPEPRTPAPRNIDTVVDWIEKVMGLKDNVVSPDGSTARVHFDDFDRSKGHFEENQSLAICQLFCNPNQYDYPQDSLSGGNGDSPLIQRIKQHFIKRAYKKSLKEEK